MRWEIRKIVLTKNDDVLPVLITAICCCGRIMIRGVKKNEKREREWISLEIMISGSGVSIKINTVLCFKNQRDAMCLCIHDGAQLKFRASEVVVAEVERERMGHDVD